MLNKVKFRSFLEKLTIPPPSYLSKFKLLKLMLFVLFLSLPSATNIFGQIVIKERVKVEPKVEINLNDISSSNENTHSIKLIREWDPHGSWCKQKFRIQYCNESVYSNADNSGHLEFDFTVLQGTCHTVTLLLNCYDGCGWSTFGGPFNIYVDDTLFKEDVHINAMVQPWYGRLGIRVFNDNLFFGLSESITYYTQKACAPIIGTFGLDYPMISIIKGNKYLSFYTSDTDEIIGDIFDVQEYIGNSIPRLKYDIPYYGTERLEAVIKSEVNRVSVYDTVIVNPIADRNIEVTCNPNTLLISEESTISLKQILEDESTIDFPDDQLFDVEIIEGAEYGTIISPYGTADEFVQIEQGFSFVANSPIDEDPVEVLIKVSTEIGGQSISSRKGKDIIAPAGGGGETIYGIGKITIGEENNCEDYACEGDYASEIPKFEVKVIEQNIYKGKDLCKRMGGDHGEFILMTDKQFMIDHDNNSNTATKPLENEFLLPYEIDACYNISEDMWQYKITTGEVDNIFVLQAIVTVCLEGGSYTVLENISALTNIDDNMLCQALIDFEYQRPYRFSNTDYPEMKDFVIKEAVRTHEYVHKRRFEKLVLDEVFRVEKYDGYDEPISFHDAFDFALECNDLDKSSAISLAKIQYQSIISEFVEKLKIKAKELSGRYNGSNEEKKNNEDNELFTQWHSCVQNIITDYQEEVIKIARERGIPLNCTYKQDWSEFDKYRNSL